MYYLRALGYRLPDFEQTGSNFGADLEHETPFGIDTGRGTMIADGATLASRRSAWMSSKAGLGVRR
ncbi:MAG: hypothetical protein ACLP8X_21380 [Streptosporangiaceae bacterium]